MEKASERVLAALWGEAPDPVVAGFTYLPPAVMGRTGTEPPGGAAMRLARAAADAGLDFAFVRHGAPGSTRVAGLLQERGIAPVWAVDGVLWSTLDAVGLDQGLRATMLDPESLEPLLDEALERALAGLETARAAGAVAVAVGEDLAGQAGPLVAPDYVNEAVMPRLARIAQEATSLGMPAILHADGDARVFVAAAARAGFQAIHASGGSSGFAPVAAAARAAGLAAMGGIPTAALGGNLATAVTAGTLAGVLAAGGGILVADDGGISTREQYAGLVAAIEAARR
jgi:Uroporphyrinogen decarboxylase (URO-D)